MKKTTTFQNCFLSLLPVTYLALSLGCTKTDSLGLAGNDDSGVDGIAPSGGSTGTGATMVPALGGTPSTCGMTGSSSLLDMLPADNEVDTFTTVGFGASDGPIQWAHLSPTKDEDCPS